MGMAFTGFTATSCNDDEDGGNGGNEFDEAANLNYTPENAASWRNYSLQVAKLLQRDATTLYDSWETSFQGGDAFKKTFTEHNGGDYTSALSCIEQIIDKCVEITDEVGNSKIGESLGTVSTHATTIPTTSAPSATLTSTAWTVLLANTHCIIWYKKSILH